MSGGDVVHAPLVAEHGAMRVRRIEPDRELIERYEEAS
jgi:hypothetical protein